MSSMFMGAISGINAIKSVMNNTVKKIKNEDINKSERVVIENTAEEKNLSAGVYTKVVYDDYDDFMVSEIRKTIAQVEEEKSISEKLVQLEDLLCEKSSLFSTEIKELYNQIEKEIILQKKETINENIDKKLQNITWSLKDFDRKLNFVEQDVKIRIEKKIMVANMMINRIHSINILLDRFYLANDTTKYDELNHKREELVDELNKLIGVTIIKNHNDYKINLNNGISIIDNDQKTLLMPITSNFDSKYISVGYYTEEDPKNIIEIEQMIPHGSLGGLLKFRRESLSNTRNKIGQLTLNFADSINKYHTMGYDKYGQIGEQIFNISSPEVIYNESDQSIYNKFNKERQILSANWEYASEAKNTDYQVFFNKNQWTVKRLVDNSTIIPDVVKKRNNIFFQSFIVDGINIEINGIPKDGESYIIKPYAKTLEELKILVEQDTPFALSLTNDPYQLNRNNAIIMHQLYKDQLVDHKDTLDNAYQQFTKSIIGKIRILESGIPFKEKILNILYDKRLATNEDTMQEYQDLTYEQQCYLANTKVLKTAESIFNDILANYS